MDSLFFGHQAMIRGVNDQILIARRFFSSSLQRGTELACPGIHQKPSRRILHMSEAQGKLRCAEIITRGSFQEASIINLFIKRYYYKYFLNENTF